MVMHPSTGYILFMLEKLILVSYKKFQVTNHFYKICFYCSGYVPEHGKALVDHGVGYAVGHDAIGHFDHHTGPFGPFGFYANYYHD